MRAFLLALVLTVAAFVVHRTAPDRDDLVVPFPVAGEVGEWGEARTFAARVESVALAEEVTDGDWTGTTGGVWLVVTLSAEVSGEPTQVSAALLLGDERYDASSRPGYTALDATRLAPGLAQRGSVLVEVPPEALRAHADDARLRFSTSENALRDAVLDVPLDLDGLEPEPLVELTPPERVER